MRVPQRPRAIETGVARAAPRCPCPPGLSSETLMLPPSFIWSPDHRGEWWPYASSEATLLRTLEAKLSARMNWVSLMGSRPPFTAPIDDWCTGALPDEPLPLTKQAPPWPVWRSSSVRRWLRPWPGSTGPLIRLDEITARRDRKRGVGVL